MIEQKKIIENKGIRESLIKSYEILEERLSQNNNKIKDLKAELKWGTHQEEKKKKERTHLV